MTQNPIKFFFKDQKSTIPKFTSDPPTNSSTNGWTVGQEISVFYPPQDFGNGNSDDDQTLNVFLDDLHQLITEKSPFQYNTNYSIKNDYHYSELHFSLSNELPDIQEKDATDLLLKFLFYGAVVDSNYKETPFSVCFSDKEKLIYFITWATKTKKDQNE